jgi:predicted nucleic acid-binding protein
VIIADTSVWVAHLREGSSRLRHLLEGGEVLSHPLVIGELACGTLTRRAEFPGYLRSLPVATLASEEEAHALVENQELHGRGIGWIDVHLIASALLSGAGLWTLDRRLDREARRLGVASRE